MGTVTAASNSVLSVAVSEYWLGGFAQTNISIQNAYTEFFYESQDPPVINPNPFLNLPGKKVVFFGVTNEWKHLSCGTNHADRLFDWELPNCLTNGGAEVAPKFYDIYMPTWFVVESNTSARVSFLSNITDCVFFSRDKTQFYRTLRDAIKVDQGGEFPYRHMSISPMVETIYDAAETNLVEMLNDPLLAPRFRATALHNLKKRYNWPATNTVPVP
jgi:hypothetical protein